MEGDESVGELTQIDGVPVFCAFDEVASVSELIRHPKNPNIHPKNQIVLLAKIISEQGWRAPITVSNLSGYITRGHGRLEAALEAGFKHVPIDRQDYADEGAELADMLADNRIAELSHRDDDLLKEALDALQEYDIDGILSGYDMDDFDPFDGLNDEEEEVYTKKINIPQYEITGECPSIEELVKESKSQELLKEIDGANISEEEKEFLRKAALRHNSFDYRKIAEYYAHATPEMQRLMENSALVIIDLENAIANGYVRLSEDIQSMIEDDVDDEE